jgi:aminoglycoside phosphotransferase (APT) family kinase protein
MDNYIDQPRPVRSDEEIDLAHLEPYLRAQLSHLSGEISIEQFPAGYSNLTFLLRFGPNELVLRRPPYGNRVRTAHDMGREYRVLSRLSTVYPLAPQPCLFCEDENVLGAPFYLMECRRGVILRSALPPGLQLDAATMSGLSESFIDHLAALHALDYRGAGLGELGKPEGYVERQVLGWTKRYVNAKTDEIPAMEQLAEWLASSMPDDSGASLIHNDYKYDNLVLAPDDLTSIIAVLDWEMATIGDPLMDLGSTLGYWVDATDPQSLRELAFGPTNLPGNLTRAQLVSRYEQATGRPVVNVLFYYTYGLFKLAVIVQQIYARYVKGLTKDARFAQLDRTVDALAAHAANALERGTIS